MSQQLIQQLGKRVDSSTAWVICCDNWFWFELSCKTHQNFNLGCGNTVQFSHCSLQATEASTDLTQKSWKVFYLGKFYFSRWPRACYSPVASAGSNTLIPVKLYLMCHSLGWTNSCAAFTKKKKKGGGRKNSWGMTTHAFSQWHFSCLSCTNASFTFRYIYLYVYFLKTGNTTTSS